MPMRQTSVIRTSKLNVPPAVYMDFVFHLSLCVYTHMYACSLSKWKSSDGGKDIYMSVRRVINDFQGSKGNLETVSIYLRFYQTKTATHIIKYITHRRHIAVCRHKSIPTKDWRSVTEQLVDADKAHLRGNLRHQFNSKERRCLEEKTLDIETRLWTNTRTYIYK